MPAIVLDGVCMIYPAGTVGVDDLYLETHDGEVLVLLGPSGCGKTTTLRLIAGLEQPTGGWIRIGDRVVNDLAPHKRGVAMVFQDHALYPHLTVRAILHSGAPVFPRGLGGRPGADRASNSALAAVPAESDRQRSQSDLAGVFAIEEDWLNRRPFELSGGQRQRVALCRAIGQRRPVTLLDEPLAGMDAPLRAEVRRALKRELRRGGGTTIYVTHDQAEALAVADRVAVMMRGKIVQFGPPELVHDCPATLEVARFVGFPPMNLVAGRLRYVDDGDGRRVEFRGPDGWTLSLARDSVADDGATEAGREVVWGLRPDRISISQGREVGSTEDRVAANEHGQCRVAATVDEAEVWGGGQLILARVTSVSDDRRGPRLSVLEAGSRRWRIGERVELGFRPADGAWFDGKSHQRIVRP